MKTEQFELKADDPKPESEPVSRVCGTCRHYRPKRNSETGRILPSYPGDCAWKPPTYDMPLAVIRAIGPFPPIVYRVAVRKDTDATSCKCWTP